MGLPRSGPSLASSFASRPVAVMNQPSLSDVRSALHRIWIGEEEAQLRREDEKKALELTALLEEIARRVPANDKKPFTLLDVAAGKSYVGLLAAELLLGERASAQVISLERDPRRVELSRVAGARVRTGARLEFIEGEVGRVELWPQEVALAVGLHACGSASDEVIESAIQARARALLLVPCCTSRAAWALPRATRLAEELGIPRAAPVRRRFLQSVVDAERTLRLEAAGYRVEVVEFVAPRVTPHNVLYRAILTHDAGRSERARAELLRLRGPSGATVRTTEGGQE
jgi:hypothetical protein